MKKNSTNNNKSFSWKKFFFFSALILFAFLSFQFYEPKYPAKILDKKTDSTLVKKHLNALTEIPNFRNADHLSQLDSTANYLKKDFEKYADDVSFQNFEVDGKNYKNVIASFGTEHKSRIIVGAHYDVCGEQAGADDNASGTTALLELARMLKGEKLNFRIDLVAYTLEEPPYFRTENMGSYIHAKSLKDKNIDVFGMVSVEMIGYFSDEPNSQDYPLGLLSIFYGDKGNFITVVKKFNAGKFANAFNKTYKKSGQIKTQTFTAPQFLQGIDYSDHLNYWKFDYSALMLTDTSFFRNKNYHKASDTVETLDIPRMCKVIDGLYYTLKNLE
ncbi:M28 family peptidase [Frigoriflavimonas asaccharolytica]|uniref:Peptidase M28 domain-containing protein n=1 Tax=Frigoriflavimonas asaccharolytica TaxID=2735899 RepID=A0A8J8G7M4_9FLAO|nr:M28 family peptidase [Frigoriflavimonas asaccharolytica]NRS92466.1 hypothetical protein [Frigoriflavimonas asaccharolytica]